MLNWLVIESGGTHGRPSQRLVQSTYVGDEVLVDEQRLDGVAGRGVVRLGVHHDTARLVVVVLHAFGHFARRDCRWWYGHCAIALSIQTRPPNKRTFFMSAALST